MTRSRKPFRLAIALIILHVSTASLHEGLMNGSFDNPDAYRTRSPAGDVSWDLGEAMLFENQAYTQVDPTDPTNSFDYTSTMQEFTCAADAPVTIVSWFRFEGIGSDTDYFQILLDGTEYNVESTFV